MYSVASRMFLLRNWNAGCKKMPEGKDVLSARLFLIAKSLSDREKERRKGRRSEESSG